MGWPGPVTALQLEVWNQWRWRHPSQTEHYVMRAAQAIVGALVQHPGRVRLDHFLVGWGERLKLPEEEELGRERRGDGQLQHDGAEQPPEPSAPQAQERVEEDWGPPREWIVTDEVLAAMAKRRVERRIKRDKEQQQDLKRRKR